MSTRLIFFITLILMPLAWNCSAPTSVEEARHHGGYLAKHDNSLDGNVNSDATPETDPLTIAGTTNYETFCSTCHKPLIDTTIPLDTSAETMREKINTLTSMAIIKNQKSITTEVLASIAYILRTTTDAPSTYDITPYNPSAKNSEIAGNLGEIAFEKYCAGCHELDEVKGKSMLDITKQLENERQMQPLRSIMPSQSLANIISYISPHLAPVPPSNHANDDHVNDNNTNDSLEVVGTNIYNNRCAGCHQPLSNSTIPLENQTISAISHATTNISPMPIFFSTNPLSPNDLDALVAAFNFIRRSNEEEEEEDNDGITLYATYCSGCHNSLSHSQKRGSTRIQIDKAIASPDNPMGHLATLLSSKDREQIAKALSSPISLEDFASPQYGTRFYIKSKLDSIFRDGQNNVQSRKKKVDAIIKNFITKFPSIFEGNCTSSEKCSPSGADRSMKATMNPLRRGYLAKACKEIVETEGVVRVALKNSGLQGQAVPNRQNIEQVLALFLQIQPSTSVSSSMTELAKKMKQDNFTPTQIWQFIMLTTCKSTVFELK